MRTTTRRMKRTSSSSSSSPSSSSWSWPFLSWACLSLVRPGSGSALLGVHLPGVRPHGASGRPRVYPVALFRGGAPRRRRIRGAVVATAHGERGAWTVLPLLPASVGARGTFPWNLHVAPRRCAGGAPRLLLLPRLDTRLPFPGVHVVGRRGSAGRGGGRWAGALAIHRNDPVLAAGNAVMLLVPLRVVRLPSALPAILTGLRAAPSPLKKPSNSF